MPLDDVAHRYADQLFARRVEALSQEYSDRLAAMTREHAARGMILSGAHMSARAQAGVEQMEQIARAKQEALLAAYEKTGTPLTDDVIHEIMAEVEPLCETHRKGLIGQMSETIRRTFRNAPGGLEGAVAGIIEMGVSKIVSDIGRELRIKRDAAILDERRRVAATIGKVEEKEWYAFICHASEDKEFVRPLAEALRARGLKVWYDEFELKVGDSLRESIDRGLANSRYGVVVLSPDFFRKVWPRKELDGLVAKETGHEKVILPVWHNIDFDGVRGFSPTLAGRVAAKSSEGLDSVVDMLMHAMA